MVSPVPSNCARGALYQPLGGVVLASGTIDTDLPPYAAFLQWRPDLDCPEAGEHRRPGVRKADDRAAALGLAPVLPGMHQDLESGIDQP